MKNNKLLGPRHFQKSAHLTTLKGNTWMAENACNFPFKTLWFSQRWKTTDRTIFQKGFQQGSEERQTVMFIQGISTRFKIKNKIRGYMDNYDSVRKSTWILWGQITPHYPLKLRGTAQGVTGNPVYLEFLKHLNPLMKVFLGFQSGHRIRLHGYLESWLNNTKLKVAVNGRCAYMII